MRDITSATTRNSSYSTMEIVCSQHVGESVDCCTRWNRSYSLLILRRAKCENDLVMSGLQRYSLLYRRSTTSSSPLPDPHWTTFNLPKFTVHPRLNEWSFSCKCYESPTTICMYPRYWDFLHASSRYRSLPEEVSKLTLHLILPV